MYRRDPDWPPWRPLQGDSVVGVIPVSGLMLEFALSSGTRSPSLNEELAELLADRVRNKIDPKSVPMNTTVNVDHSTGDSRPAYGTIISASVDETALPDPE
jgi:hypothetical protein